MSALMDDVSVGGAGPVMSASDAPDPGYPVRWEGDVALGDGGTMHVRPIRPDDAERLVRFHGRQSPESIYFRFFSPRPKLSRSDVERFTHVDYVDRFALVGLVGDDLIGVARYDRYRTRSDAEVAFFVDDEHHRRGVATILLEHLAVAAREAGIAGFTASVLPQNRRMLAVFTQAGFAVHSRFEDGVVEVQLAIEPTPTALAAIEERAKVADARSVKRLLHPRSIAVIGASRRVGTVGHALFRNLLTHGFEGPVHPVNPEADYIGSVKAWPTVLDIPGEVDLAVIATPASQVHEVVEQCAAKRVYGLVVISSGFADAGDDGAANERALVSYARSHGMRLIGPNCLGVINNDPSVAMHATFAEIEVRPGRLAISSQSGTIGAAIVDYAARAGLGLSTFVAVGNKADVSGNDLLRYWEDDEATDVVLLYLESFGNPRQFARIARRVSQRKPIVAVRLSQGVRPFPTDAAATGGSPQLSLWAEPVNWPPNATVDALLAQTGIVRVDNLTQMVHAANVLLHQPLPQGRRVGILSNASGTVQLATDACRASGLDLAVISDTTRTQIAAVDLQGWDEAADHHVDLPSDVGAAAVAKALCALLADPGVDSVIVLYAPPISGDSAEVAAALLDVAEGRPTQPIVACFLGNRDPALLRRGDVVVPEFPFPEEAALALARVSHYGEWRREPAGELPTFDDADFDAAHDLVARLLDGWPEGRWLDPRQATDLLATYGIDPLRAELVANAEEAVAAARTIGYPVALKATLLPRLAKTEAGGVSLDVHGDQEIREAYRRMSELLGPAMRPALVQDMADPGIECLVGLHRHPVLGDVMTLGPGGATAERLEEVALRIVPLTTSDADRLVRSSRIATLLDDAGPGARAALADLLLRLSALADAVPEITQVRLNPVFVSVNGAAVTDARIHVQPWQPDPRPEVRRL
jgi:acyl-CoA synthetase (NDP forming)/GNAT superfamily N-acetyltransferase